MVVTPRDGGIKEYLYFEEMMANTGQFWGNDFSRRLSSSSLSEMEFFPLSSSQMMSSFSPLRPFNIKHFLNAQTIIPCKGLYHAEGCSKRRRPFGEFKCTQSLDSSRRRRGPILVSDKLQEFLFQTPAKATTGSTKDFPVLFTFGKHILPAPLFANCGFFRVQPLSNGGVF